MFLKYLAGPVIGAVIGYCTNYLAVKMMFYPKKEIRIGGHKLPFTPGAIPKGKPRLARAIGGVVGSTLLTREDLEQQLLSEDMECQAVDQIMELLSADLQTDLILITGTEEKAQSVKQRLVTLLSEQILDSVNQLQLGSVIVQKGGSVIKEKTAGTMLQMFLSDDLIHSIADPVGTEIERYIAENGASYLEPELERKLDLVAGQSPSELLEQLDLDQEKQRELITAAYRKAVSQGVGKVLQQVNVSHMVEEKINAMNMDELEELVLSVMKKELDTIVNLGALIGALLGIINIFL